MLVKSAFIPVCLAILAITMGIADLFDTGSSNPRHDELGIIFGQTVYSGCHVELV